MKIKRYEGTNEQAVIENVKNELGPSAIIVSIKTIKPRGVFSMFRKPKVEVTAAYENTGEETEMLGNAKTAVPNSAGMPENEAFAAGLKEILAASPNRGENEKDRKIVEQSQKIKILEENVLSAQEMMRRMGQKLSVGHGRHPGTESAGRYRNNIVQSFYDNFIEQGVSPQTAEEMLEGLDVDVDALTDGNNLQRSGEKIDINFIVKIVYNKIIKTIGKPEIPEGGAPGKPFAAIFMGPTGVGKTTTIAKLCADFILNKNHSVSLISADTYRIAAVEQLRTYADILDIDLGVVYTPADLAGLYEGAAKCFDVILIDTAGRSHKNGENMDELEEFLNTVPNLQKYLVLSLATKFEDMLDIVAQYSKIADFSIIFTKLDETKNLGSVLNLCHMTGKAVSYITFGQNVPNDIRVLYPDEIARAIMCGI